MRRNPRPGRRTQDEFNAKDFERPGLSSDEIEEIKEAFDIFDIDQSGEISVSELLQSMKNLGFDVKNKAIYQMIAEMDDDGNGTISFEEFLDMMTARISEKNSREDLMRVFNLFDVDRQGEISVDNLRRVAQELGEEIDEKELAEIVQRADLNGNSQLDFDDFYNIMTRKTFA